MLCSKGSISQDPRLRQPADALLLRYSPRLVLHRRRTAGSRYAAAHVVLQRAVPTAGGCRSVTRSTAACYAASGSTLDTPDIDASSSTTDIETVLQDLLAWLVANGVTGVGQADSQVALYQDADGDRGIIAVEDIPAGVELVRVPLRLAITDVMDDQQRSQLVGQGALWQDRLVAKLLHEVQLGKQSAWYPYIRALPRSVPSALESFSASEALQVQLPAAVAAIQGHAEKMSATWQACRPDAISRADLKTYRWAHSCVMSRTFGNAAPGGGIGVHMMVPLIDMLNHAGDETESGLLSDPPVATDNVSNDEFLLHYGFVPDSNPHDSVQLFGNISEALEHLWWQEKAKGKCSDELPQLYRQALDAGLAALQQEVEAAAAGSNDTDNWGRLLDELEPIKIASGSRVSNSLIAALEILYSSNMAAAEAEVAALAWQQLAALPTTLLYDLALLISDQITPDHTSQDQISSDQIQSDQITQRSNHDHSDQSQYISLLQHYAQALLTHYYPQLAEKLQAPPAAAARAVAGLSGSSSSSSTVDRKVTSNAAAATAAANTVRRKKAVPSPPQLVAPPAAAAAANSRGQSQPQAPRSIPLDLAAIPLATLISSILQLPALQQQQQQLDVCSTQQFPSMPPAQRTAVKYRLSKKMLLIDVILAARVPLAVLEQQRQLCDKAMALRAAWLQEQRQMQQHDKASACLPWLSEE